MFDEWWTMFGFAQKLKVDAIRFGKSRQIPKNQIPKNNKPFNVKKLKSKNKPKSINL